MESHVLRLKLAPPSASLSNLEKSITNDETHKKSDNFDDMGGWSFLQSLKKTEHHDNVYVHPTIKLSSSMLSEKSLEMCTESLGSESGSSDNASDNMDEIANIRTLEASRSSVSRRIWRSRSFPPPLTSIRDMGGVHITPHREDGRLILKAVATPSAQPYFEAERSNGRLKLWLFQTFTSESDNEEEVEEEEEEDEEEEKEEVGDDYEDDEEVEMCGEEEDGEAEELEGNNEIVEEEMGKRKLARPRMCKESGNRNKGMPNWKPFWVAT